MKLVVLAVLFGLFGMHGLTMTATGCHAMPSGGSATTFDLSLAPATHDGGSDCVATVPRAGSAAAPLTVVAVVALLITAAPLLLAFRRRFEELRGPPMAGVRLLDLVCVSRT